MNDTLTFRQRALVGLTLFSMFFGAGNLIFPPFLGALAGDEAFLATVGFAVTAVGFPILGVVAVAKSGGLDRLAGRVHPKFAFVFTLLIYLSIGPCLAIPRTASTSFEMAVLPFVGDLSGVEFAGLSGDVVVRFAYSLAFFALAGIIALKPEKLTARLGKILGPTLLALIALLFVGCLLSPQGQAANPAGAYEAAPFTTGFLEGYQTMDAIAALNFGLVIVLNVKAFGVKDEKVVVAETVRGGVIAGSVLLAVYCALSYVGFQSGVGESASNGAQVLSQTAGNLFGEAGTVLLGAIFFIACLNTCVGLLSCCSEYFSELIPKVRYEGWVAVFAVASMVVSNAGLDAILAFSVPVLSALYPVAIVLIVLGLAHRFIGDRRCVYRCAILVTGVVSILSAIAALPFASSLSPAVSWLPMYDSGLGWLVPALLGTAGGYALSVFSARTKTDME